MNSQAAVVACGLPALTREAGQQEAGGCPEQTGLLTAFSRRSLLTGRYPPTSGRIVVDGRDLQTHLAAVRRELGVCPQRDVLFETLTVREHLLLFASIKAPQWTRGTLRQQVDRYGPALLGVVHREHGRRRDGGPPVGKALAPRLPRRDRARPWELDSGSGRETPCR